MNSVAISGAILLLTLAGCQANETSGVKKDPSSMTLDECHKSGGHEVIGGAFLECKDTEFMYGHISAVHCACICCGPDSNHPHLMPPYPALHEIPLPKRDQYVSEMNLAHWKNPYLSITAQGVEVRGRGAFSRDQIEEVLIHLPRTAWPYGRVVAIHFSLKQAPKDKAPFDLTFRKTLAVLTKLRVHTEQF